ncbi:anthranilate phosphoribosyltransferase [Cytophagales bacterium LB-30]|uniref:Anthranilate phosphoribosyltransferase n=1 Tax=Shiella aurantiaca TaxID=3058365 RepID=A0ABT8F828_9BACT|nr:anthranilate phosphoribosyltransferase [Shiella aurantiaca]MDN4166443.1 anthranilate phosphoribosyltransferase [Shiella aurantiaca]
MKEILNQLFEHKSLSQQQAKDILVRLTKGEFTASQVASFLTVFLMRPIALQELRGFREAMMELCIPLDLGGMPAIDLCGTGGDGKSTFNISTLSSFVVAASGVKVAKHGNYGVSSICGSSNVLQYFGYEFTSDSDRLLRELDLLGITFLHAPLFHPAMKSVAPIRRELGVKTFFNMLGPMVNPARPSHQMVGVFSLELARLYHYLFQQEGKKYAIVHSHDGYDEISLTGPFTLFTHQSESIETPQSLGLSTLKPEQLTGGETVEESAAIFLQVIKGQGSAAQEEAVVANSAMAIQCAKGISFSEAKEEAKENLRSGKAHRLFEKLLQPIKTTYSIH